MLHTDLMKATKATEFKEIPSLMQVMANTKIIFIHYVSITTSLKLIPQLWTEAHTTNSEVWPVPYARAQPYHPGGSHGQLFHPC